MRRGSGIATTTCSPSACWAGWGQRRASSIPELHRRAARWYEQQGMVDEAIGHALSARDFQGAARLVEEQAPRLLGQGGIVTLLNWANRLPEASCRPDPASASRWAGPWR